MEETIAAIATAPGTSALSIVRMSGESAIETADKVFRGKKSLLEAPTHTAHHGFIVDPNGKPLDEVVATVFRAPAGFTGEDSIEITCHGGRIPAKAVLDAIVSQGARVAEPGEFTKRAFLNGKLDLLQAEAVCDLIESKTRTSMRVALRQLEGGLSSFVKSVKEDLLSSLAEFEARIDFPEDVDTQVPLREIEQSLEKVSSRLSELLKQKDMGRAFREGLRVPIVGGPNVGKSSLFNAILREERAIVTEVPGTTRDFLEGSIDLEGFPVTFVDTCGLRETEDPVEVKGVERTLDEIRKGDIIIYVVDPTVDTGVKDELSQKCVLGKGCLLAQSKSDLMPHPLSKSNLGRLEERFGKAYETSSLKKDGIDELVGALCDKLKDGFGEAPEEVILTNMRHALFLERVRDEVLEALSCLKENLWEELVCFHLGEAISHLGEITGEYARDEVLDLIFSRFCVGK